MTILKRLKKPRTQQSLATILARKNVEIEQFLKMEQFLIEGLIKQEITPSDDYIMNFYVQLVEQLARLEDQHTSRRVHISLYRLKNW
jgi:hypothetical protein